MTQQGTVVSVYIDAPGLFMDKPFDYVVPTELGPAVQPGQRVFVSFHHQFKAGIIWQVHRNAPIHEKLKPILSLIDQTPVLTSEQLDLASWLCDRYACTMNDALSAILPGAFRVRGDMKLQVADDDAVPDDVRATELWRFIAQNSPSEAGVYKSFGKPAKRLIQGWISEGYVYRDLQIREEVRPAHTLWFKGLKSTAELLREADARAKRAAKQAALLTQLASGLELAWDRSAYSKATVDALRKSGLVEVISRPSSRLAWAEVPAANPPSLTDGQARVLSQIEESIRENGLQTLLLFGVTGSGKTEVYIRAIERVLSEGKSAIVLVPEIALTPQMVGRFYARFGERIAVLHSGLTMGERRDEWDRILRGDAGIVIGARSAVFAPVQNLGLLIVDEEHEPSYKQEESPHYDARDVARYRCSKFNAVSLFGSATPSLSAIHLVESGLARMVTLPVRVNQRPLPQVQVIDMRDELREGNKTLFSRVLTEEIERTVAAEQQVILFLNRRGFASSMLCRACGERMTCPHCDISLTVHRDHGRLYLSCHYCGYEEPQPKHCPACQEPAMRTFGIGTEQIEEATREMWPKLRVLRMDVDTTRQKGSLQKIVDAFERREADVLIGTQMIAKGLDFPHVRLVGVIAADTMLSVPDYRANERTFQLLTQVAGRAGRAETDGVTVIQTYRPDHFSVMAAAHHDFQTFYREERMQRDVFHYPPFCEMAVLLTTHENESLARGAAMRFERELRRADLKDALGILPASPSGIRRIENKFRYQVVLKYDHWESVRVQVSDAYRLVKARMNEYGGACRLDVNAQRIG